MRTFVLGAGASLHVGYPLIKDLGPKLVEWVANNPPPLNYPYWPDPEELKKYGPLDDIEEIVTTLEGSETPGTILAGLREAVCVFFDSIRTNNASLYRQLASEVVQNGDVVITFNYDVSLDRELREAGKWEISNGYGFDLETPDIQSSATTLLKLHGSTNWMDSIFAGLRGGQTQQGGGDSLGTRPVILPREFEFLGYAGAHDPRFTGGGMIRSGSMVLPGRRKQFYVSTSINPRERQDFGIRLWTRAREAVEQANEIVVVGYSFSAADEDARSLVFKTSKKDVLVSICCGQDTNRVGNEFAQSGFSHVRTDSKRFEDWLATQRLQATSGARSTQS
jgi:hypothetical protein